MANVVIIHFTHITRVLWRAPRVRLSPLGPDLTPSPSCSLCASLAPHAPRVPIPPREERRRERNEQDNYYYREDRESARERNRKLSHLSRPLSRSWRCSQHSAFGSQLSATPCSLAFSPCLPQQWPQTRHLVLFVVGLTGFAVLAEVPLADSLLAGREGLLVEVNAHLMRKSVSSR